MGPALHFPKTRILVTSASALVVALGVGYGLHVLHWPKPSSPEGLIQQADALAWKNQWLAAQPVYERARTLFVQQHRPAEALYAEVSEIPVDVEHTNVPLQIERLTEDLQRPEAGNEKTRLRLLEVLGMLETNYDAGLAQKTWAEVATLAKTDHRYWLSARASGEEGIAAYMLGDLATAKTKVGTAWVVAKYLGDAGAHVRYASLYGAGEVDLGQYQPALSALDEAIATAQKSGTAYPTIAVLAKIEALSGLGRFKEAFALADQAEAKVRQYGLQPHLVDLDRLRGNAYNQMGDTSRSITAYAAAIHLAEQIGYWRGVMQGGGELAAVYERSNNLPLALTTIDRALAASANIPDEIYLTPRLLARKAELLQRMGQTAASNALFQKAADLVDGFLMNSPTETMERNLIVQLGDVYSGYFNSLCSQRRYADAFRILEKARGRIEAQSLEHRQAVNPALLSAGERRLVALNTALLKTDDEAKRAQLLRSIGAAEGTLESSALAERAADSPVELHELQTELHPEELVLEYSLDEDQSYVLAITSNTVARYPIGTRVEIETAAAHYRSTLSKSKTDPQLGQALFSKLLGSVPEYRSKKYVTLVPDGKLSLLPFSALMDGEHFVITDHVISTVPSSTVLHLIRTRARANDRRLPYVGVAAWTRPSSPFAVVKRVVEGPEESEFVPLPESKQEVENVGADLPKPSTILLGGDATETKFKELPLRSYNVLHLALHGYADLNYPDRSALVFAPENSGQDDGLLQIREIRHLDLDAGLVTLSACDTGVGPTGQSGVANIANAFIEAGARTVVSTLWALDDRATAKLMSDFYSRLASGETKGQALAGAQEALAETGAAPYFWANFEIVGDPDSPLIGPSDPGIVAEASTSGAGN